MNTLPQAALETIEARKAGAKALRAVYASGGTMETRQAEELEHQKECALYAKIGKMTKAQWKLFESEMKKASRI